MSAHTPGPWNVMPGRSLLHVETDCDNPGGAGVPICSLPLKAEANARLIAAAPDLLDALRDALTGFTDLSNGWPERELHMTPAEVIAKAVAALAKAEGRAP
jgi:hypothetical protein